MSLNLFVNLLKRKNDGKGTLFTTDSENPKPMAYEGGGRGGSGSLGTKSPGGEYREKLGEQTFFYNHGGPPSHPLPPVKNFCVRHCLKRSS